MKIHFPTGGLTMADPPEEFVGTLDDFRNVILAYDEPGMRKHLVALDAEMHACLEDMVAAQGALMKWRERGELSLHALTCWSFGHLGLQSAVLACSEIVRGHALAVAPLVRMLGESEAMMLRTVLESEFDRFQKLPDGAGYKDPFSALTRPRIARELEGKIDFNADVYRHHILAWKSLSKATHASAVAIVMATRLAEPTATVVGGEWDSEKVALYKRFTNFVRNGLRSIAITADRASLFMTPDTPAG